MYVNDARWLVAELRCRFRGTHHRRQARDAQIAVHDLPDQEPPRRCPVTPEMMAWVSASLPVSSELIKGKRVCPCHPPESDPSVQVLGSTPA